MVQVEIDVYIPHRKYSDSKVKFRQAINHCKRVLEAAELAHANETIKSITFQKLGSSYFWQIANSVLNKGKNLLYLFNSTAWRCCLLHLIKQNCLLQTILRTLILMTQVCLFVFSLLELIFHFNKVSRNASSPLLSS